jgi:hypothetical protein
MSSRSDSGAPGGRVDPERLAALLDGRLSGAERDAVLAQLGMSADDLEIMADAVAVESELAEMAEPPSVVPVVSLAERRASKTRPVIWVAIAAGLVLVAIPLARRANGFDIAGFTSIVARDSIPAGWVEQGSVVTRGAGAASAAELGMLATDLRVAASRDIEGAKRVAGRMATILLRVPQTAGAATKLDSLSSGRMAMSTTAADVANASIVKLHPIIDRDIFAGAAWLRAGWLASAAHDSEFFNARESARAAESVDRIVGGHTYEGSARLAREGRWDELSANLLRGLSTLSTQ